MRKILISFHLVVILFFNSCNLQQNRDNGFVSRLHTPNEEINWFRILGPTTLERHLADFDVIEWEKEFWEEYKSERDNNSFLEVFDSLHNTHLSVSTFPNENNSFQFTIYVGSRAIKDKKGKELEKGYVRCFLLKSNDSEKVRSLMRIFFERNYDLFFSEVSKLQVLFECESIYQNIE